MNLPSTFVGLAANGLAIGDLRTSDGGLDLELALQAIDDHLEVQLAHAGDHGLAGLLVGAHLEGRVLLAEALEGDRKLLLVDLGLRLDREVHDRVVEGHRLEHHRSVRRGQRVARGGLLETDARGDVARVDLVDLLARVRVHHQDAADALGAAGHGVEHAPARGELARVDAEVGELADVRVGHDLEGERREGLVVGGWRVNGGLVLGILDLAALDALDRLHVERARQVVDHGVEQRLHALVLEGGAGEHRGDRDVERRLADVLDQPVGLDRLVLQVVLHQLLVVVRDGLDEGGARLGGDLDVRLGDVDDLPLLAEIVLVDDRLHVDQVDDAGELGLGADRQLDLDRIGAQTLAHALDGSCRSARRRGPSC